VSLDPGLGQPMIGAFFDRYVSRACVVVEMCFLVGALCPWPAEQHRASSSICTQRLIHFLRLSSSFLIPVLVPLLFVPWSSFAAVAAKNGVRMAKIPKAFKVTDEYENFSAFFPALLGAAPAIDIVFVLLNSKSSLYSKCR
jgi:hypothetical protein